MNTNHVLIIRTLDGGQDLGFRFTSIRFNSFKAARAAKEWVEKTNKDVYAEIFEDIAA